MSNDHTPTAPIATIGIDLGKNSFHLIGMSGRGEKCCGRRCRADAWNDCWSMCHRASSAWRPALERITSAGNLQISDTTCV